MVNAVFYKKWFFSFGILLMAQISFAGVGSSCDTVASGNWSNNNLWNCSGGLAPEINSTVTIKSGHTVLLDVDTVDIASLLVETGGDFDVAASVNGFSLNSTAGPTLAFDLSNATINLSGDFSINGNTHDINLGSIEGGYVFAVAAGSLSLNSDIGGNGDPLDSLSISASGIQLNASMTTTNDQEIVGGILMNSAAALNGSIIDLQGSINNNGFNLTINNSDTLIDSGIDGILSGAGDFIKMGLGGFDFSTQTSMTGNVLLSKGSLTNLSGVSNLFVNSPVITLATGTTAHLGTGPAKNVDLMTNQRLKGSGLCDCTLNVLDGVVAPGLNSGQVTNSLRINSMLMNNQSTLEIQLNGSSAGESYDQVIVDGANVSNANLNLSLGFTPTIGDSFTIINVTGPPPVTGTFNGLLEGDKFILNNHIFSISYSGGGNDVVLTVVATRYYVDADAAALGDGLSWNTAFNNLQDALAVATSGEIWIAEGVYYPDVGLLQVDDEPSHSFNLIGGLTLLGGFSGNENDASQRDVTVNLVVLSGDIDNNDINNNNITEDTDDIVGLNAYHVLTLSGDGNILDGLTVTAGFASLPANKNIIENKGVADSRTIGGGMNCNNNSITLLNMNFSGNFAQGNGGAMYRCPFLEINNSQFLHNKSLSFGGAIFRASDFVISNTQFIGNSANNAGGLFGYGTLNNSLFKDNVANIGGAITNNFDLILNKVSFINNSSMVSGGALEAIKAITMENCLFSGNESLGNGGAINSNTNGDFHMINTTITGNKALNGAGIWSSKTDLFTIENSIIWHNEDSSGLGALAANLTFSNSIPITSYSIIQGSGGSNNWDLLAGIDGGNNLDTDPLFLVEADLSMNPIVVGDSHLDINSPSINAGNNGVVTQSTDLDDLQRIRKGTVDMGAYEYFVENVFSDGFE